MTFEAMVRVDGIGDAVDLHKALYAALLKPGASRDFLFAPLPGGVALVRGPIETLDAGLKRPVRRHEAGAELNFVLRAAPNRKLGGKRVRFAKGDLDGRLAWLRRRADDHGFGIVAAAVACGAVEIRGKGYFDDCVFSGRLRVIDPERFGAALAGGIGAGRAYGFGMLRVA